jgi:PLP dependent protein
MVNIRENVEKISKKVAKAAIDAGRDPSAIKILAASKYTGRNGVEELIKSGITLIGENRVQDALAKLGGSTESNQKDIREVYPDCRMHLIGNLQKNKINHALRIFDLIETVDAVDLADALQKRLATDNRILPILIEVKLTGEESKTGCPVDEIPLLLQHLKTLCPNILLRGFMGMGPWDSDPETARPFYRRLKELFERYKHDAADPNQFDILSMGMSGDFHIAIQEGATLIRIGRAFFE